MRTIIIGDIHGQFESLMALAGEIKWHDSCQIYFCGDLVNVGPNSVDVVRWAMKNNVKIVLGNHDLHMLSVMRGKSKARPKDTFHDILEAHDRQEIFDWLVHQPLALSVDASHMLVHAGVLPGWTKETILELCGEVEAALRADPDSFFEKMYGNEPSLWRPEIEGVDRLRIAVNALTRARVLHGDGRLDFDYKGLYGEIPGGLHAWFDLWPQQDPPQKIIFGHWSALGAHDFGNAFALDSGAAWGRELSALELSYADGMAQYALTSVPVI